MSEPLPISIVLSDELSALFDKITSVTNKLEAQFNFQTMTANWYGNEHEITFVQLDLQTPDGFAQVKENQTPEQIKYFSDDVFLRTTSKDNLLVCYIAITHAELALLTTQTKLLAPLLTTKLRKVLNLIAEHLSLDKLTD